MSSALDEFKKPMEEWARATVDGKPMENLLILYKLLYAMGCRIDGIEFEIDRLCLAAIKKEKHSRNPLSPLRSPRKDCPWNEGTNLQILSIVGVVELLAWQIVIARRVDAQNIKRRLRNSNFGLVVEVGIGEINNKSPQPVYAVSVDRYSADLTADDSYEITNRLNSVFRRRLKQSESGADHIGAQKKHSTVQSELCIDSPLHARLSPAEQDLLGKVQRFFNEVV